MADIYLSYTPANASHAKRIAETLSAEGWSVWWDISVSAVSKSSEQLRSARCVVALWSHESIGSTWVIDEAEEGKRRGVLVQAVIDDVDPPLGFRQIQTARLFDRNTQKQGLEVLVEQVTQLFALTASFDQSRSAAPPPESSDAVIAERSPRRRVFLCYRRQDTQGHTGRLRDRLATIYGNVGVFMDVDDIPHGVDFVDHVEGILSTCALMVVLIGPLWTTVADRKGRRKLDKPDDLVRAEIAAALKRKIPVIPVLVEDATMPDADDVPEDIRSLTRRNAIELTHRRWNSDVELVLTAVKRLVEPEGISTYAPGSGSSKETSSSDTRQPDASARVQRAHTSDCTYTIHPTESAFPAKGAMRMVMVSATAGCEWTATSNVPWITVNTVARATGDGTVAYTVAPNAGDKRTGTLTIAGHTLTVTQTSASPSPRAETEALRRLKRERGL